MKALSKVSIIIVNYNAGSLLLECVERVFASAGVILELFIVDNASDDGSLDTIRSVYANEARLNIIQNNENLGFARAANCALIEAQNQYLLFLNPDCLIQTDTLQLFCQLLNDAPNVGMAGPLVLNEDGSEQTSSRRDVPTPGKALARVLYLHKFWPSRFPSFELTQQPLPEQPTELEGISGACMFVRREALEQVGPLDETYFLHCEDLDWFMRFRAQEWRILFAPHINVTHIQGSCSRREPIKVLWYKHRGMVKFYRKFFRTQYPALLMLGVISMVWVRFALLAALQFIMPASSPHPLPESSRSARLSR
ncbi:MAG: glycosyltransferase family 2 protein [Pseudomonadota bacterium]